MDLATFVKLSYILKYKPHLQYLKIKLFNQSVLLLSLRMVRQCGHLQGQRGELSLISKGNGKTTVNSVSYTHLDVYKRQSATCLFFYTKYNIVFLLQYGLRPHTSLNISHILAPLTQYA